MSWSIDLKADRNIPVRSVKTALRALGEMGAEPPRRGRPAAEQEWGWSCTVDVSRPRGRMLPLSGAGFSKTEAEGFAESLALQLRRLHLKISVGRLRD